MLRVSLDQWAVLVSVVDSGTYAKAAERLHKSQSTLTYGIQKLEEQLGVKVFEIRGRKAVLTAPGEVLYRRGKALVDEAARLEHAAGELAQGWEPEIRLAVEIIYPTWLLVDCFARFAKERPDTRIELIESVLGGTGEALAKRQADFAIGAHIPPGYFGDMLMPVRFQCMAAPSHPLHHLGREVTSNDLRRHRHLVIRDTATEPDENATWVNEQRWTVSHKATSIFACTLGLGYAWYPEEAVRGELERGALKPLPLREGAERHATLYLVFADRDAAGPGARRLSQIIREETAAACRTDAQGAPRPA
jgi:DNA-binding transcriptional LysR family regulator